MATAYRLAQGELRESAADRGGELEAVPGARGADDYTTAPLEDEVLVRRGRVEAGLRLDGARIDVREAVAHPGCDTRDDRRLGRRLGVWVGLGSSVVRAGLEPVHRIVERVHPVP